MKMGVLKNYYSKFVREGWLKSFLYAFLVGLSALSISFLTFWIIGFKSTWVAYLVTIVSMIISAPIFYYVLFYPKAKTVISRIDALGLEERVLTMTELEGETSYIALRQREDAKKALEKLDKNMIRMTVSVALVIALAVVRFLSFGALAVYSLYNVGLIKSGMELVTGTVQDPLNRQYKLVYGVSGYGGEVSGETEQTITNGDDGADVVAVPQAGWVFVKWTDGSFNPYRQDTDVTEDIVVNAVFQELDEDNGEEDAIDDIQSQDKSSPNNNSPTPPTDPTNDKPVKDMDSNQVIDGETYYGDVYDGYYDSAVDEVSQDGNMSDDLKDIISDYYDAIENN